MTIVESAPGEGHALKEQSSEQLVEKYIDSAPPTRGIYGGGLVEAADGVYVSPVIVHPSFQEVDLPQFMNLELLPGAYLGAGDSHHGVVFGQVAVKRGKQTRVIDAGIKPFTTDSELAGHEHDALIGALKRGFETYTPMAVARDGVNTYLITQFRDEVETLDNANWSILPGDVERYQKEVVPTLHFVAKNMADMHAKGLFHGDSQAKNYARTDTGDFVVIDLEVAIIAKDDVEHELLMTGGEDFRDSRALIDVWHFWVALTHPTKIDDPNVFLEGETFDVCMEQFETHILNPYLKALPELATTEFYEKLDVEGLRTAIYDKVAAST